jgi:hypothetical protein
MATTVSVAFLTEAAVPRLPYVFRAHDFEGPASLLDLLRSGARLSPLES